MNFMEIFNNVMATAADIAVASESGGQPNVRLMSFLYDSDQRGVIYIVTFAGSTKTLELSANCKAAFTTIPEQNSPHVRVQIACCKKSMLGLDDIKGRYLKKNPFFADLFEQMASALEVWEITFKEADVIVDMQNEDKITL